MMRWNLFVDEIVSGIPPRDFLNDFFIVYETLSIALSAAFVFGEHSDVAETNSRSEERSGFVSGLCAHTVAPRCVSLFGMMSIMVDE